jgi:hypothetical protein
MKKFLFLLSLALSFLLQRHTVSLAWANDLVYPYRALTLHQIQGFPQPNIIQLEDGSEWSVPLEEMSYLSFWLAGDLISIYPNMYFFRKSPYLFYHEQRRQFLSVTLFTGPLINGPATHYLIGIDRSTSQVYLMNGQGTRSAWLIDPQDTHFLQDWEINDPIILGNNHQSWFPCLNVYKNILIHVPCNHHVKARLY